PREEREINRSAKGDNKGREQRSQYSEAHTDCLCWCTDWKGHGEHSAHRVPTIGICIGSVPFLPSVPLARILYRIKKTVNLYMELVSGASPVSDSTYALPTAET